MKAEMQTIVLAKHLTRDAPLIAFEYWYKGRVISFKEFFGFTYPATVFIHNNGAFEYWTDEESFDIEMPKKLSVWIKENKEKLGLVNDYMVESLEFSNNINMNNSTSQLFVDLVKICKLMQKAYVGLVVSHHLPIFDENFRKKGIELFDNSIVNDVISWREEAGNIFFNEMINTVFSLLNSIAIKKEWDRTLLKHITLEELRKCIENNKDLPIDLLEKRKKDKYAFFDSKVIYQDEIKDYLLKNGLELGKSEVYDLNELKGQVANTGKAKGTVKVIFNREELDKFNEGDILVAPMTCVWYTKIMKKSSAIITDEGGVTCHAAILSREFDKPCIIGTKFATQILKDGDIVEVDAGTGIVRKK